MFRKSEKRFLKLLLRICRDLGDLDLKLYAIDIRFTRRNYENISEKANVLTTMLNNPKIAPVLAFIHCGMFSDPQVAYKMSMEYVAEQEAKAEKLAAQQQTKEGDEGNEPGKEKSGYQPGSGKGD